MRHQSARLMSMPLENVPCPFCGSTRHRPWAEENGFFAVRCEDCSFVYVNPRVSDDTVSEAAKTGLHQTGAGRLAMVGRFRREKVPLYRRRLQELYPAEVLRRPGLAWLDVGAGYGELLLALRELTAPDARLEGVEPCLPKVAKAQALGLNVSATLLQQLAKTYDVVSLVNVFSHLPDPRGFLRELKRLLRPGGEVFVVTGNGADIEAADYPKPFYLPDHLVFAGERHLRGLLEGEGFTIAGINRYPEFLPEACPVLLAKNAVKMLLRHPHTPWREILARRPTPFRSLFVRAVLKE